MRGPLVAPAEVRAQFARWCRPVRGAANPEDQTNPVWSWLVCTEAYPHAAHEAAGTEEKAAPGWCFSRYGQTETTLPDGTRVLIGGEHEDFYDPDFYIYNEMIVRRPDGSVTIYGYPADGFAPTDFHSATRIGDHVLIIGGLGYAEDRDHADTPVHRLSLADFSIERIATTGTPPPRLKDHQATVSPDGRSVRLEGGEVAHHGAEAFVENIGAWALDLDGHAWRFLGQKPWHRWVLRRADRRSNELWQIGEVVKAERSSRPDRFTEEYRARFAARGHRVDADLYDRRFRPPIPHEVIEQTRNAEDYDFRTHRVRVGGTVVRYHEGSDEILVTVEGDLPQADLAALQRHGTETFARLEGVPYERIAL